MSYDFDEEVYAEAAAREWAWEKGPWMHYQVFWKSSIVRKAN